jgi:hypothetical protein
MPVGFCHLISVSKFVAPVKDNNVTKFTHMEVVIECM